MNLRLNAGMLISARDHPSLNWSSLFLLLFILGKMSMGKLCAYLKPFKPVCTSFSSVCCFPMLWMCEWWGRGVTVFLACMCACVSVVVTPPSPSSLFPSCDFSLFSPPPPLCVFPALFLTLGRQRRAPAPPLHRWRVLPHPTLTHSHSASTVHCWKSYSDLAILDEQANGVLPRSPPSVVFQAHADDVGEATGRLWKEKIQVINGRLTGRTLLQTEAEEMMKLVKSLAII